MTRHIHARKIKLKEEKRVAELPEGMRPLCAESFECRSDEDLRAPVGRLSSDDDERKPG